MTSGRRASPLAILAVIAIIITILDQITKYLASETLGPDGERETIGVIPSILQFRYAENTGAAFGMFQDSTTVLAIVSLGVIALLALIFWRMIQQSLLLAFAFGLQLGGAVGNLIDRVRLGYVVDFIDVPDFPNFNVADSGITVGVVILAYVLLFYPEHAQAPARRESGSAQQEDPVSVLSDGGDTTRPAEAGEAETTRDSTR